MGRITDYTAVTSTQGTTGLADADVFIIDGANGTKKITAKELANAMGDKFFKNVASNPTWKNGIYRGANLGTGDTFALASTSAQRDAIKNGDFSGLFVGDYWTIGGKVFRIADFNYYKSVGDSGHAVSYNHLVMVPDASVGNDKMNDTNTTVGAYVGSKMYTDAESSLNKFRASLPTLFSGYAGTYRSYLPNATDDAEDGDHAQSAGAWFDSTAELMNEIMVYGSFVRTLTHLGTHIPTADKTQLALFRLNPQKISGVGWLRDVVSAAYFAYAYYHGATAANYASSSGAVRPAFVLRGVNS